MVTLLSPSQNKPSTMDEEPESTQMVPRLTKQVEGWLNCL
jgi:hypothetical protein